MLRRFGKYLAIGSIAFGLCVTGLAAAPAAAGPITAPGKADKLPVPPTLQPSEDYPVAAGGKEDRQPVPPETTKRKSGDTVSADDRLTPDAPDPDRLRPE